MPSARPHGATVAQSLRRGRAPPRGLRWQHRLTSLAPASTVPLSLETGVLEAGPQSHRLSSAISASSWGLLLPLTHKARASMRAPSSRACLTAVPSTHGTARPHRGARRNSCRGYLKFDILLILTLVSLTPSGCWILFNLYYR